MSYGPEVFRKYLDILDEKNQVNEGTWGYPESDADVAELKELLKQPIPLGPGGEDAMAVLGKYFGDDDLYDALGVAGDKNPEGDANLIFKDWMERRIQDNDYGLGPETKEIYDQIYEGYTKEDALQDVIAMNPPATTAQAGAEVMRFRSKNAAMASKNAYAKLSPEEKKIANKYLRTKDKPGIGND